MLILKTVKIIRLKEDTMCAHDLHEMTKYPRPNYKPKPALKAGTELIAESEFTNFYGAYYRARTEDGLSYDIEKRKAESFTKQMFVDE